MKILITGGAGFGGSGIARELVKRDHHVKVVDILSPNSARNLVDLRGKVEYSWKSCHDLTPHDIEGYDVLVHMAAQADVPMGFPAPVWTMWENSIGTQKTLEAAKEAGLQKFVLASSGNVFGRPLYVPIDEDHPLTPHNPYAASKACQEMIAQGYMRSYNIPLVTMRNGIVYGPNMRKDIFVYIWLQRILRGESIYIEGGEQTRDPCYCSDTADAWVRTIEADPEKVVGQAFQVSRGKELKMRDIAMACMEAAGREVPVEERPYRPGEEGQRECFSIEKAKNILGYEPKVDLAEGLPLTAEWIKKEESL